MKRLWIFAALLLTGCSTAPVADFMDYFFPGRLPTDRPLQQTGGVCIPQGGPPGDVGVPVVPPPALPGAPGPGPEALPPPSVPGPGVVPAPGNGVIPPPQIPTGNQPVPFPQ